jgi:EAL domain-containing protein (putative c-di-GMP-specific phosphodiesterase class I)
MVVDSSGSAPSKHSGFDINTHIVNPDLQIAQVIEEILASVRLRLNMEIAFVSRFVNGQREFQYVNSSKGFNILTVGCGDPLDESYCYRVMQGITPQLIHDAQLEPSVVDIAATQALPVGAHISVPIILSDGSIYGTFCAFSREVSYELNDADLATFKIFSDVIAGLFDNCILSTVQYKDLRKEILSVMVHDLIYPVVQPMVDIRSDQLSILGYEALCRVEGEHWNPESLFQQALSVGLSVELNQHMIQKAFKLMDQLVDGQYLALNVTPDFILSDAFIPTFDGVDLSKVVLEITEHAAIANYVDITDQLAALKARGVRIAIDDAGAGYSSFRHILAMHPDIIKIDRSLIENLHKEHEKQELVQALVKFAQKSDYTLVAEGVELTQEQEVLCRLGIKAAQGFLFARPARF